MADFSIRILGPGYKYNYNFLRFRNRFSDLYPAESFICRIENPQVISRVIRNISLHCAKYIANSHVLTLDKLWSDKKNSLTGKRAVLLEKRCSNIVNFKNYSSTYSLWKISSILTFISTTNSVFFTKSRCLDNLSTDKHNDNYSSEGKIEDSVHSLGKHIKITSFVLFCFFEVR